MTRDFQGSSNQSIKMELGDIKIQSLARRSQASVRLLLIQVKLSRPGQYLSLTSCFFFSQQAPTFDFIVLFSLLRPISFVALVTTVTNYWAMKAFGSINCKYSHHHSELIIQLTEFIALSRNLCRL